MFDANDAAERFGTPLYVYDGDILRDVYQALRERLHPAVDVFYSLKANPNVNVCAVLAGLGAGAEVSSLAELRTAQWAGVDPRDTIFLGPGKSAEELRACVEAGVHAVVVESFAELDALEAAAGPAGVDAVLRVNPDFTTKGARLSMGGKPRQFGVDQEQWEGARERIAALRKVRVGGVHVYMGTRNLDPAGIAHNTRGTFAVAERLAAALGIRPATVDIGGGLGVAYFDNEKDLDLDETTAGINAAVAEFRAAHPDTRVILELGRFLAARCGTYVVRVRYVKQSRGEWFAVTDGGMNHHMAAVGVGSFVKRNFPVRALSRPDEPAVEQYTITGPLCTPDDVLGRRVALPELRPGDLIGIERSGAYGPSASPVLFLSHGHPAEVMVLDGAAHLVRDRDTVEDLLSRQHLIAR